MGDIRNALKKVQTATRIIKLSPSLDAKEASEGSVKEYLRLYHYLFLDYNAQIAADIVTKHNVELSYLNDKSFVDGVYRLCRDMLAYTPRLTKDQFFHAGFAQAKAEMAAEIIERVRSMVPTTAVSARSRADSIERDKPPPPAGNRTTNASPQLPGPSQSILAPCRPTISASSLGRQSSIKTNGRNLNPMRAARPLTNKDADVSTMNQSGQVVTHQGSIEETEANRRATAVDSLLMIDLIEKVNELNAKMDQLTQVLERVDKMEQRLGSVEKLIVEVKPKRVDSSPSATNEMDKISNKMTLLETELLLIKQGLSQQQARAARLSYDPNDSTTYETPHQSFMLASPGGRNGGGGDELSESHDLTLNGADLTPTLPETASRHNGTKLNGLSDASLDRATNLLKRASLLSSSLAN